VPLRDKAPRRHLVWLVVVLVHAGLIAAVLLSRPRLYRETRNRGYALSLLQLPDHPARTDAAKITVPMDASRPNITPDLAPIVINDNAITLSPSEREQPQRIDWDRESELAVQSSIAQASKEKNYRDLSGLTKSQLDWVKKNHMEPTPSFAWDRNSRGEMLRHGIIKLNDYCVLIVVMPFCRFGGKIQYNGDLFRDMHDPKLPDQ
jgi:hypothetical protein